MDGNMLSFIGIALGGIALIWRIFDWWINRPSIKIFPEIKQDNPNVIKFTIINKRGGEPEFQLDYFKLSNGQESESFINRGYRLGPIPGGYRADTDILISVLKNIMKEKGGIITKVCFSCQKDKKYLGTIPKSIKQKLLE